MIKCEAGVPQGCVLGPLFFIFKIVEFQAFKRRGVPFMTRLEVFTSFSCKNYYSYAVVVKFVNAALKMAFLAVLMKKQTTKTNI